MYAADSRFKKVYDRKREKIKSSRHTGYFSFAHKHTRIMPRRNCVTTEPVCVCVHVCVHVCKSDRVCVRAD